jgi:hypothetical protein
MIHINLEKYLYQGSERLRDSFQPYECIPHKNREQCPYRFRDKASTPSLPTHVIHDPHQLREIPLSR